jgi:hypothetical protein
MPPTEKRKKALASRPRFCGDCGYELAADSDGCPMCARFEQLRREMRVLGRSELAGRGPDHGEQFDTSLARPPSAEQPPKGAEYRAIVASLARSMSTANRAGQPAGKVIRKPTLRQPKGRGHADSTGIPTQLSMALPDERTPPRSLEATVGSPRHTRESAAPQDEYSAHAIGDVAEAVAAAAKPTEALAVRPPRPVRVPRTALSVVVTLAIVVVCAVLGALVATLFGLLF